MKQTLFIEINKFNQWAQTQSNLSQDDIGGEWECNYDYWSNIYQAFKNFIISAEPQNWTNNEKEQLLYIIARDNETEFLAGCLNEQALIALAKEALVHGHRDDKWQLAVQLHRLADKQMAITLLEGFVNDEEEYVNRRALMELAKLEWDKTEQYAQKFWNRNKYGEMEEYQKIAALHALKIISSNLLDDYIAKAMQDGRKYLVANANNLKHDNIFG